MVMTYSRLLPDIHQIVQEHMPPVLHGSTRMKSVFPAPSLVAFRRDKNLRDALVHGKTNKLLKTGIEDCECGILSREPMQDAHIKQRRESTVDRGMLSTLLALASANAWCTLARQRHRSGREWWNIYGTSG